MAASVLPKELVPLQAAPRPSGASSSPGLAGVDVGQWEVQFNELQMKRLAGEGSFGKVRSPEPGFSASEGWC